MAHSPISRRIGNLEARICTLQLTEYREGEPFTMEIVQWWKDDEACHVLAYFRKDEQSEFELISITGRLFVNEVDGNDFMILAQVAYNYLRAVAPFMP